MFATFLQIAAQLNKLGITPLLMGSVGLERRTGRDWQARDLDIHVPSDPRGWEAPDDERIYRADELIAMMENWVMFWSIVTSMSFKKMANLLSSAGSILYQHLQILLWKNWKKR